jgi:hypothetical protein
MLVCFQNSLNLRVQEIILSFCSPILARLGHMRWLLTVAQ